MAGPAARTVDDERGERRRLDAEEVRLPASSTALRVEGRLVAENASLDRPEAARADRAGEPREVRARERRITVAPEIQVPVPDAPAREPVP